MGIACVPDLVRRLCDLWGHCPTGFWNSPCEKPGHSHDLFRRGVWTISFEMVIWLVLYRYMFVMPMFAIARGAQPGFFSQCVAETKRVWSAAVPLALLEIAPSLAHSIFKLAVWGRLAQLSGFSRILDLPLVIAVDCFAAWFILVKTGIALQLMPVQSLDAPQGDGPAVDLPPQQA